MLRGGREAGNTAVPEEIHHGCTLVGKGLEALPRESQAKVSGTVNLMVTATSNST
jgi:hypothetical protein